MKLLLTLLCALISAFSLAQTEAIATYTFQSYGGFEMESTLKIKGNKSYYSRYQENVEFTNEEGYTFWHYKNHIDWYKDGETGIIREQRHKNKYPLLTTVHPQEIEWELLDETDVIAGYQVRKAKSKALKEDEENFPFGEVIAWYTLDLPFSTGPERYHGLPGLIIRIEYTGRNEKCTLKEIEFKKVEAWEEKCQGIEVSSAQLIDPFEIDKKWLKEEEKKVKKNQD